MFKIRFICISTAELFTVVAVLHYSFLKFRPPLPISLVSYDRISYKLKMSVLCAFVSGMTRTIYQK